MEHRYWHGLYRSINPLGFGCWQLAGDYYVNGKPQGWGAVSEADAVSLIHYALDHGIQFFDTAAGYGDGRSEEIVGKGISGSSAKDAAVICTKIVLNEIEINECKLEKSFISRVEKSLQRLKRDRIDVLLIHNPPDNLNWPDFDIGALEELKKQGKISTFGVSCRSLQGAKNVIDNRFGSCLEWVFNLLERRPVDEIFPKLEAAKMNFIARSPLSRGFLTPKYLKNKPIFKNDDFRSTLPLDWINWVIESAKSIVSSEEDLNNISKTAIRYCLSYDEMSVVIPGIKKLNHLENFLNAMDEGIVSAEFIEHLKKSTDEYYPAWG